MKSLRILVIDDSAAQLAAIRKILGGVGHKVETTTSREEAARLMAARPFELVIIDYHMPDHDGADVLDFLKSARVIGTPKYYVYTTDATMGSLDQMMGFDGAFLAKGNVELLKSQVETVASEIPETTRRS
jgi:CheY-like chemotaxis protein